MIQESKCTQTLTKLGLTLLQAKAYLALTKLGKAEVKAISRVSNVARQDVYRVMPTLLKLGLVEKIVATPTVYQAVPLKDGLSTLLQQKTAEDAKLQKNAEKLIEDCQETGGGVVARVDEPHFIITSERALFRKRIAESTNTARKSSDAIYSPDGFRAVLFHQRKHLKRALKRGVRIRIITQKPENKKFIRKITESLRKSTSFELKYTTDLSPINIVIFDNMEVNIRITEGTVPSLWSNNPNFVKLAMSYFDDMWSKAHDAWKSKSKIEENDVPPKFTKLNSGGSQILTRNQTNREFKAHFSL
jgi:sugar-specific transcriptional regulator TrmB